MTDYRNYYSSNLEGYLLGPVRDGFQRTGFLSAMDEPRSSHCCRATRKLTRTSTLGTWAR